MYMHVGIQVILKFRLLWLQAATRMYMLVRAYICTDVRVYMLVGKLGPNLVTWDVSLRIGLCTDVGKLGLCSVVPMLVTLRTGA